MAYPRVSLSYSLGTAITLRLHTKSVNVMKHYNMGGPFYKYSNMFRGHWRVARC